jgi:hypothetical protein
MVATNQIERDEKMSEEASKLELYRLIGEGYKAMEEGRVSDIEDVAARLAARRKELYG